MGIRRFGAEFGAVPRLAGTAEPGFSQSEADILPIFLEQISTPISCDGN